MNYNPAGSPSEMEIIPLYMYVYALAEGEMLIVLLCVLAVYVHIIINSSACAIIRTTVAAMGEITSAPNQVCTVSSRSLTRPNIPVDQIIMYEPLLMGTTPSPNLFRAHACFGLEEIVL
jgi:hypothetical protein